MAQIFDDPLHPYTVTLRTASPIPDPGVSQPFAQLKGEVPSPISPPSGCHFHPRCAKAMDICSRVYPEWIDMGQIKDYFSANSNELIKAQPPSNIKAINTA